MARRRRPPRREVTPDPKYSNENLTRFINKLMLNGKKTLAYKIVYDALDKIETDTKQIGIENDPEYVRTQEFLAKTNNLIARTKAETDARAKEIEALTNRVGELIANMGSTSEDAFNLRSELAVQIDLLKIERETTEGLRRQMLVINKRLETEKQSKSKTENKLQNLIVSLRAENKGVRKSLRALEIQNKNISNTETKLRSELQALRLKHIKSIERLESKFESVLSALRRENATANKRILLYV